MFEIEATNIEEIAAAPESPVDLDAVETALTHLLAPCWALGDAFNLCAWHEYYQKALFVEGDGGFRSLVLVLDNDAGTARAVLQEQSDITEWTLVFDELGALTDVRGARGADVLADTAWRMLRLVAEGSATAVAIDRPTVDEAA
jgi:hypothetical protein